MTFKFTMGGYFSDANYKIVYRTGELHCTRSFMPGLSPEAEKVIPVKGNKDWEALLAFLAGCNWEKEYWTDAEDGTQWNLRASRPPHFRLTVNGSNAYPDDFPQFLGLLNALTSGSGFNIEF